MAVFKKFHSHLFLLRRKKQQCQFLQHPLLLLAMQRIVRSYFLWLEYPSVQHIGSTQGPHLFSTQNPSVQRQKPLSSAPKPPKFHTPLSFTPKKASPKNSQKPKKAIEPENFQGYAPNEELDHVRLLFYRN